MGDLQDQAQQARDQVTHAAGFLINDLQRLTRRIGLRCPSQQCLKAEDDDREGVGTQSLRIQVLERRGPR